MPVVPETWEAKVEGLLEPRRLRLQRAAVTPLYCNLGIRTLLLAKSPRQTCRPQQPRALSTSHEC
ncbi:Transmembrane protein 191A [Plecturocebus cupreus]